MNKSCSIVRLIAVSYTHLKNIKGNILWGILITWLLGIICQFTGLYVPNADLGFYSLLPDFSNGLSIPSLSPIFCKLDFSGIFSLNFIVILFAFLFVDCLLYTSTTLSEGILYLTGQIRKPGRVDHGDAFLDNYALERQRGITIFSKQAVFQLGDSQVTLLDTPGHVDFSAEMERTLQVLDYAVLVVSGADGVQGHTRTLWNLLARYRIPTFIFVNKMDQPGTDKTLILKELKKKLDASCVDMEDPEDIATGDERALEEYLEAGEVSILSLIHI